MSSVRKRSIKDEPSLHVPSLKEAMGEGAGPRHETPPHKPLYEHLLEGSGGSGRKKSDKGTAFPTKHKGPGWDGKLQRTSLSRSAPAPKAHGQHGGKKP